MENLTKFSITRILINRMMRLNGIRNISFVMVNDDYALSDYVADPNIITISSREILDKYSYSKRLSRLPLSKYFIKGSKLFAYLEDNRIIAYNWLHTNYDPHGELKQLKIRHYHITGPAFVEIRHRGQRLSGKLKHQICSYAKETSSFPVFAVNSFDNLPIIKSNLSERYRLKCVLIKLTNHKHIVLRTDS